MRVKHVLAVAAVLLTVCLCAAAAGAEEYRTLKQGMEGKDVLRFKQALYWLGYFKSLDVSDNYNGTTVERVKLLQKNNDLEQTGVADADLQALVFSGAAVPTDTAPSPSPVPPPTPSPTPAPTPMPLPPRTEEGFLSPEVRQEEFVYANAQEGRWLYLSHTVSIELTRYTDPSVPLVWYEGDIHCSPQSPLNACVTGESRLGRTFVSPMELAKQNRLVLAFSDDHFGHRLTDSSEKIPPGIIIRNGAVITEETWSRASFPNLEILAVFEDGSMKTFASTAHTAQEYLAMGAVHTYAFGPILVQNGELSEYMLRKEYYTYREPRIALGMIAPYHYYLLCAEGRMSDRSKGVYLTWLADNMLAHGVVEGMNLDGGGTAALMFMGEKINKSPNSTRVVTSLTGFGVSSQVPGK